MSTQKNIFGFLGIQMQKRKLAPHTLHGLQRGQPIVLNYPISSAVCSLSKPPLGRPAEEIYPSVNFLHENLLLLTNP